MLRRRHAFVPLIIRGGDSTGLLNAAAEDTRSRASAASVRCFHTKSTTLRAPFVNESSYSGAGPDMLRDLLRVGEAVGEGDGMCCDGDGGLLQRLSMHHIVDAASKRSGAQRPSTERVGRFVRRSGDERGGEGPNASAFPSPTVTPTTTNDNDGRRRREGLFEGHGGGVANDGFAEDDVDDERHANGQSSSSASVPACGADAAPLLAPLTQEQAQHAFERIIAQYDASSYALGFFDSCDIVWALLTRHVEDNGGGVGGIGDEDSTPESTKALLSHLVHVEWCARGDIRFEGAGEEEEEGPSSLGSLGNANDADHHHGAVGPFNVRNGFATVSPRLVFNPQNRRSDPSSSPLSPTATKSAIGGAGSASALVAKTVSQWLQSPLALFARSIGGGSSNPTDAVPSSSPATTTAPPPTTVVTQHDLLKAKGRLLREKRFAELAAMRMRSGGGGRGASSSSLMPASSSDAQKAAEKLKMLYDRLHEPTGHDAMAKESANPITSPPTAPPSESSTAHEDASPTAAATTTSPSFHSLLLRAQNSSRDNSALHRFSQCFGAQRGVAAMAVMEEMLDEFDWEDVAGVDGGKRGRRNAASPLLKALYDTVPPASAYAGAAHASTRTIGKRTVATEQRCCGNKVREIDGGTRDDDHHPHLLSVWLPFLRQAALYTVHDVVASEALADIFKGLLEGSVTAPRGLSLGSGDDESFASVFSSVLFPPSYSYADRCRMLGSLLLAVATEVGCIPFAVLGHQMVSYGEEQQQQQQVGLQKTVPSAAIHLSHRPLVGSPISLTPTPSCPEGLHINPAEVSLSASDIIANYCPAVGGGAIFSGSSSSSSSSTPSFSALHRLNKVIHKDTRRRLDWALRGNGVGAIGIAAVQWMKEYYPTMTRAVPLQCVEERRVRSSGNKETAVADNAGGGDACKTATKGSQKLQQQQHVNAISTTANKRRKKAVGAKRASPLELTSRRDADALQRAPVAVDALNLFPANPPPAPLSESHNQSDAKYRNTDCKGRQSSSSAPTNRSFMAPHRRASIIQCFKRLRSSRRRAFILDRVRERRWGAADGNKVVATGGERRMGNRGGMRYNGKEKLPLRLKTVRPSQMSPMALVVTSYFGHLPRRYGAASRSISRASRRQQLGEFGMSANGSHRHDDDQRSDSRRRIEVHCASTASALEDSLYHRQYFVRNHHRQPPAADSVGDCDSESPTAAAPSPDEESSSLLASIRDGQRRKAAAEEADAKQRQTHQRMDADAKMSRSSSPSAAAESDQFLSTVRARHSVLTPSQQRFLARVARDLGGMVRANTDTDGAGGGSAISSGGSKISGSGGRTSLSMPEGYGDDLHTSIDDHHMNSIDERSQQLVPDDDGRDEDGEGYDRVSGDDPYAYDPRRPFAAAVKTKTVSNANDYDDVDSDVTYCTEHARDAFGVAPAAEALLLGAKARTSMAGLLGHMQQHLKERDRAPVGRSALDDTLTMESDETRNGAMPPHSHPSAMARDASHSVGPRKKHQKKAMLPSSGALLSSLSSSSRRGVNLKSSEEKQEELLRRKLKRMVPFDLHAAAPALVEVQDGAVPLPPANGRLTRNLQCGVDAAGDEEYRSPLFGGLSERLSFAKREERRRLLTTGRQGTTTALPFGLKED